MYSRPITTEPIAYTLCSASCGTFTGALDEVDWLRNKLERLETSISAMARTAGAAPSEGGAAGNGPQSSGQAKEYRYDKSVLVLSAHAQC